jgi:pimeloyl-ACP methyl ester carboxylesterase
VAARLTTFTNDDLRFDVRDSGPRDGPVIIALHGFPQTSACWDAVTPLLTAAGHRVLAPDQRGYSPGARPAGVEAYRVDRLAGDVLALADAVEAEQVHLLGHDWGGGVAWFLASRYPDRILTLTVASTPHPRAMFAAFRGSQALRSGYIFLFRLPLLPEVLLRHPRAAGLRLLLASSAAPHPEDSYALMADPAAVRATVNWYRAIFLRGAPVPGPVSVPALYVWSDRDPALGRRAAEGTAAWAHGPYRFEVLRGGTHWIPEDRPRELAELVLDHVRRHAPSGWSNA